MTLSAFVVVADDRKLRPEEAGFKKIRPGFKDDEERAMEAMIDEWEEALIKKHATQEDMENITYVLHKEAGDSNKTFQHGWKRDCDPLTGEVLPARTSKSTGKGKNLKDFMDDKPPGAALHMGHLFALRLYTTGCYESINRPFRNLIEADGQEPALKEPYPFPCTLALISDALGLLRQLKDETETTETTVAPMVPSRKWPRARDIFKARKSSAAAQGMESTEAPSALGQGEVQMAENDISRRARPQSESLLVAEHKEVIQPQKRDTILWRGFRNRTVEFNKFLKVGGSELAPSSTTEQAKIAVRYAHAPDSGQSLIFRLVFRDFMQHGGNLEFLSAFPHEVEVLYPPLTYFGPKASYTPFKWEDGVEYTIIDVTPHFPGGQ